MGPLRVRISFKDFVFCLAKSVQFSESSVVYIILKVLGGQTINLTSLISPFTHSIIIKKYPVIVCEIMGYTYLKFILKLSQIEIRLYQKFISPNDFSALVTLVDQAAHLAKDVCYE